MDCEVLYPEKVSWRARLILEAMIEAMPGCRVSPVYTGRAPVLMSWGLGHPQRRQWTDAHLANGGRVIGWDLGYWDRSAMRVTVDHNHPWRVMRDMPGDRWHGTLREDADPSGPVMLVGMGPKSRSQFGWSGLEWEAGMLARIRAAWPGREVVYRPKKGRAEDLGIRNIDGPIEDALKGCSLVVCRHSNVAVDACIAGVPVVCEDGAGRALYGSDLLHPVIPAAAERRRFLQNLGYFQWLPTEAVQAWSFLQTVLSSTSGVGAASSTAS